MGFFLIVLVGRFSTRLTLFRKGYFTWPACGFCLALVACGSEFGRLTRSDPPATPESRLEQPSDPIPGPQEPKSLPAPETASAEPASAEPAQVQTSALFNSEPAGQPPDLELLAELDAKSREEREMHEQLQQLQFEAVQQAPRFDEWDSNIAAITDDEDEGAESALFDELNEEAIPENFNIARSREDRLRDTKSDLPLVLNKQVIRLINYFTSRRGSKTFKRTLERSGAYAKMIDRILEEEGVPKELFHLAQAESGFRAKARSRARATGMWQFMSFRGRQYGLRRDRYMDERNDPEKATRAAARHLKDLHIEFGDWYLAMAAYNGGPGRVRRSIKASGSTDYWELSRRHFLRRETRNYVPIILAMTYVAKNDWLYDSTEFDWAPELRYDTVETSSAIHFEVIADIVGIKPETNSETIKQLNPALLRSATPPLPYSLRLPEGTGKLFEREIALIPADKRLAWSRYEVKEGDSLAAIAKRFKVRETQVAKLNSLPDGELPPGLRLTIPGAAKRVTSYYSGGAGGFVDGGSGRYKIAQGDTLGAIARRFRVTVSQLRQWNSLASTRIRAGRYLIVNPNSKTTVAAGRPGGSKIGGSGKYKIRRGDSLSVIARRYRTTVTQLKAWNRLASNRLQIGRYLIVRSPDGRTQPTRTARSSTASSRSRRASEPIPSNGQYRIRQGDNLSDIADRFGTTVAELKRTNGLRSSRIRAGKYLTVGPATAAAGKPSVTRAASAPSSRAAAGSGRYKIRRGDTLELIAKRFGTTVSDLKSRNRLRTSRIIAGDYLIVGSGGAAAPASSAPASSTSSRVAAAPRREPTRYKIRRGDTLAAIAKRLGVTVAELKGWNGLRSSRIRAGKYLAVHGSSGASRGTGSAGGAGQYLVRNGDTLEAIASRFGVTVKQLQAWNGLRGTRIRAGKHLIVRPAGRASAGSKVAAATGS